jgi:type II restriction enzyme
VSDCNKCPIFKITNQEHCNFKTIPALNPSKNAVDYWLAVNKTILSYSKIIEELWKKEKEAATESTEIAKKEGLAYLASEREKIMRMSHDEALKELVKMSKIESKIKIIQSISDSGLFGVK